MSHTGLNRPLTLDERVDRMLAIKLSQRNVESGGESLEDATDFNIDDEFETEPTGNYDFDEMQEEFLDSKPPEAEPAEPEKTEKVENSIELDQETQEKELKQTSLIKLPPTTP